MLDCRIINSSLLQGKKSQKKNNGRREITIGSFKIYTLEHYQRALKTIYFPSYEYFTDMDAAYTDFIDKTFVCH